MVEKCCGVRPLRAEGVILAGGRRAPRQSDLTINGCIVNGASGRSRRGEARSGAASAARLSCHLGGRWYCRSEPTGSHASWTGPRRIGSFHAATGVKSMSTITTSDGVEIFYKDWGQGQAIVFHHGWPLSCDDWDAQMLFFLHHGYRVVGIDRRGHGRSSQVADGHDLDHYAADAVPPQGRPPFD